jgi:hypothetical protein
MKKQTKINWIYVLKEIRNGFLIMTILVLLKGIAGTEANSFEIFKKEIRVWFLICLLFGLLYPFLNYFVINRNCKENKEKYFK